MSTVAADTNQDVALRRVAATTLRAAQRQEARATTLIGALVALVALPAWAVFDSVLLPHQAAQFLTIRLLSEAAIALVAGALWWPPIGQRWPELLSLVTIIIPELAIAWMIPRSGNQLEAYLLGFSLAIYATAFLLVWRWQMTVVLATLTGVAIGVFSIGAHPGLDIRQATTAGFYLTTAAALAIAAQIYRARMAWRHHLTQAALEAERCRNATLVEELDQLTREDPLTAVGNRRAWDERLTADLLRARRSHRPLSIILCDLDHFKAVNDDHGHSIGDSVLRTQAALLVNLTRPGDFVARLGGDEFAIICPDTPLAVASALAADLTRHIRTTPSPSGVTVTCSIGVAELADNDASTEALYQRADLALYDAKMARDTVRCAPEPD